jgi:hypothetical protein
MEPMPKSVKFNATVKRKVEDFNLNTNNCTSTCSAFLIDFQNQLLRGAAEKNQGGFENCQGYINADNIKSIKHVTETQQLNHHPLPSQF